jgi:hypothetical protein
MFTFLNLLSEAAADVEDHVAGYLLAGYGASLQKMEFETEKYRRQRERREVMNEKERVLRQRYFVMRGYLMREGLVVVKNGNISLTQRGASRLQSFQEDFSSRLRVPGYTVLPGLTALLVIFDIPESQKRKRVWLRRALKSMSFTMLQRSVWIGRGTLPDVFLADLSRHEIGVFVEIFEITKKGTLHRVLQH